MQISRHTSLVVSAIVLIASATIPAFGQANGPGNAVSFDGSEDFVSVPHTAALNAYPLTVMAWFRTTQTTTAGLVSKYNAGSLNGYQIYIDETGIHAWYFRGGGNQVWGALDGGPVADGQWHHVAFVVDADGGRLYLDGTQCSALAWTGTPGVTTTFQSLHFGAYPGTTAYFNGQMDEVSIWQTNLATAQIQNFWQRPLAGNEPGLVGYWRFSEASGASTTNSATTGSALNGSLIDATRVLSGAKFFPAITAVAADGVSDTMASLNASVNPGNLPTGGWFEWGTTTGYGSNTATLNLPATNAPVAISTFLSGLSPATTYHFRFVATNSAGTSYGGDFALTTSPTRVTSRDSWATGVSMRISEWKPPIAAATD